MLTGDLVGAEEDLSLAAELHGRAGAASGRALSLERLAAAAVARGRRARAGRLLADALGLARSSSLAPHLVVRAFGTKVQAALGSPDNAAATARASREELAGTEVCEPCSIGFLVSATVAFARAGSLDEAGATLDHAERVAGMWQGGPWLAAAWEARAELRLAGGESRQAAALFREAANLFSRTGHHPAQARCLKAAEAADAARPVRSRTAKAPARNARGTPPS
jgi:ATP/maltotriose-dependent transcriptional regulator MalT